MFFQFSFAGRFVGPVFPTKSHLSLLNLERLILHVLHKAVKSSKLLLSA